MIFFVIIILAIILSELYFAKRNSDYLKLLRRIDEYLMEFRHLYYKTPSISEAFEKTDLSGMKGAERVKIYRLFQLQCEIVRENGDTVTEKGSVFQQNISTFRKELGSNIRELKERRYEFSGMSLVCCAPLTLTGIIERWALSGMPAMESFYSGAGGFIVRCLLALSVIWGYLYILKKREGLEFWSGKKSGVLEESEEVKDLRSVIITVKDIKGMTVVKLLEIMQSFSCIFSGAIGKCLNEYAFLGIGAIRKLKEETTSKVFGALADNLLFCDSCGIQKAFEETALEQDNFLAEQELISREALKRNAVYSYIVSMVPMCVVIVLYLTLPFILESMQMLEEVINNIKEMETV